MKDITVLLYRTNMREITSYWFDVLREITSYKFDVQRCTNFKQLFDLRAVCRGNNELFLVPWNKTLKYILIISCLVSIVKYNNNNSSNSLCPIMKSLELPGNNKTR